MKVGLKMKKILGWMLVLSLLCAGSAWATDAQDGTITTSGGTQSTTVIYKVEPATDFTVTIPANFPLSVGEDTTDSGSQSLTGSQKLVIQPENFNVAGKGVAVALTKSSHGLKLMSSDGMNSIEYTIGDENGTALTVSESPFMYWKYGDQATAVEVMLTISAEITSALPAGEYTDTLTFTVSVVDESALPADPIS